MLAFLAENAGTIIVLAILIAVLTAIVVKFIRDKKKGKSLCSCGCAGCPSSSTCHANKIEQ